MKILLLTTLFLICSIITVGQKLTTIKSKVGTEETYEEIYVSLNGGCSLSCAIGWEISTSSSLNSQGLNSYQSSNMDDGKKETAWVEGTDGYGIGEKIKLTFEGKEDLQDVPFRAIQITNGYAKNDDIWKLNSRIRELKLVHNKRPAFIIELAGSIYPQYANFLEPLKVSTGDIVTLEIISVYKELKYSDTAISDLSLYGAH